MNPTPYYRGMPLVDVSSLSAQERDEYSGIERRLMKGVHRAWQLMLTLMVLGVVPLFLGMIPLGSYFLFMITLTVIALVIAARLEWLATSFRKAADCDGRWTFGRDGVDLLVPGWVVVSGPKRLRRLDSAHLAWVGPEDDRTRSRLESLEKQELVYRQNRLIRISAVQLLGTLLAILAVMFAASGASLSIQSWALFAAMFTVGAELGRKGLMGFAATYRMEHDASGHIVPKRVAATEPAMQGASSRVPELLGCLHNIEVLPSRLLWTVDGKPAKWRVQNTVPTFVPRSLVNPRPGRRLLSRLVPRVRQAKP